MNVIETEHISANNIDSKLVYLQLLQEPISRMSSTSAIFKGFSAAILAGLATVPFANIGILALLLGLLPILSFLCLDVYYLQLERNLRYRYRMVAEGKAPVDFSINTKLKKDERIAAKSGIARCLISPSILLFYVPILVCAIILVICKCKEVV